MPPIRQGVKAESSLHPLSACIRVIRGLGSNPVPMRVEKLKYIIWAADLGRAVRFYTTVFDGEIVRESEVMAEISVAGSIIGIHGGGEGKVTWTGLSFQVADLFAACEALRTEGGVVVRPPEETPEEPAHLAMCRDPEGNEIMLTRPRGS